MGNLYLRYNGLSSPVSIGNMRLYSFYQTPRSMKKNYAKSTSFAQSLQKSTYKKDKKKKRIGANCN